MKTKPCSWTAESDEKPFAGQLFLRYTREPFPRFQDWIYCKAACAVLQVRLEVSDTHGLPARTSPKRSKLALEPQAQFPRIYGR